MQPDRADDVRRSGLEPRRRVEEGRLLECDLVDHRPAALPRRHLREQFGASPEAADARRAIKLVSREGVEVGTQGHNVHVQTGYRLATVQQQQRTLRMGDLGRALGVEDRAQHIGYVGKSYDTMFVR